MPEKTPDDGSQATDPYFLEKRNRRNDAGVKNSADLYRTFNGDHYPQYAIDASNEYVARLRAAGVRCRRLGQELFVHNGDIALAGTIQGDPWN